jgi:hypothetical protein
MVDGTVKQEELEVRAAAALVAGLEALALADKVITEAQDLVPARILLVVAVAQRLLERQVLVLLAATAVMVRQVLLLVRLLLMPVVVVERRMELQH